MVLPKRLYSIAILISLLVIYGCASNSSNRKGRLSDAMEKSSDDYEGDRFVETIPDPDFGDDEEKERKKRRIKKKGAKFSENKSKYKFSSLFVRHNSGGMFSNDFYGINGLSLNLRVKSRPVDCWQVYLGYSIAPVQETSHLSESIKSGVGIISLGTEYVKYTTPSYTFLSHFFLLGLEYNIMSWSYKNPIEAFEYDDYGNIIGVEKINNDFLSGVDFHMGTGLSLFQTESVNLGMEVIPGIKLWWFKSNEGFSNDIFPPFPYLMLKGTINFKI